MANNTELPVKVMEQKNVSVSLSLARATTMSNLASFPGPTQFSIACKAGEGLVSYLTWVTSG